MARAPNSFFGDFVLPLVAGGELHVGRPLDAEDLVALQAELITATEETLAIEMARRAQARELWPYPVDVALDRPALELAVALHNLLFTCHPAAERWWMLSSSLDHLQELTAACARRPPPPRRGEELVARHTLLGQLPTLGRTDVEVRFWAGRRTFRGQRPPRRLMRWKGLRGVHEHSQQVTWVETDLDEAQTELLSQLFRQSPLTDLLSPLRAAPRFEWLPVAHLLAQRQVCRLVCHSYLELGLERVGPTLAAAFWRLVDGTELSIPAPTGSRTALKLVGGLVVYLYAAVALTTDQTDHLRFDAAEPTGALPGVLMAATRCGLLPDSGVLGEQLRSRLEQWGQLPTGPLGEAGDDLTRRLESALAA